MFLVTRVTDEDYAYREEFSGLSALCFVEIYVCTLNDSTESLFNLTNLLSHPATTWRHVQAVDQMGCLNTINKLTGRGP